ncbi:MAG: four helix bundle protein [Ignavibacteriales bacterium]|nr:four helix bundle protein [Ignavibacteriales bacterium]
MEKPYDINERTFEFALAILELTEQIPASRVGNRISDQLIRAGTSIGANLEEATGASSKAGFVNKVIIALKEARETCYWLRIILRKNLAPGASAQVLLQKAEEIKKILGSIASKARNTSKQRTL